MPVQIVTLSGPADTVRTARELLTDAGYWVLSKPPVMLDVADDESLLAVESDDPDAPVNVVAHLNWRHRSSARSMGRAVRIGGQG
jgi:hypothetical protein